MMDANGVEQIHWPCHAYLSSTPDSGICDGEEGNRPCDGMTPFCRSSMIFGVSA